MPTKGNFRKTNKKENTKPQLLSLDVEMRHRLKPSPPGREGLCVRESLPGIEAQRVSYIYILFCTVCAALQGGREALAFQMAILAFYILFGRTGT